MTAAFVRKSNIIKKKNDEVRQTTVSDNIHSFASWRQSDFNEPVQHSI